MPGLYAAGETACVSINGANRLGSNSLTELLVFGTRAGKAAARFARDKAKKAPPPSAALARDEWARIERTYLKEGGTERIATIRREMQHAMEKGCGVYRKGELIQATCDKLRELRRRFANIRVEDRDRVFNTDLTAAIELDFMLDIAQAMAEGAMARTESRGAHQRLDFRARNDKDFLAHTIALRTEDGPRLEYRPAVITRWQPEERKY